MHICAPTSLRIAPPPGCTAPTPPLSPTVPASPHITEQADASRPTGAVLEMLMATEQPPRMLDEPDGRRNPQGGYDVCGPNMPGRGACEPTLWERFTGMFSCNNSVRPTGTNPEPNLFSRLTSRVLGWFTGTSPVVTPAPAMSRPERPT